MAAPALAAAAGSLARNALIGAGASWRRGGCVAGCTGCLCAGVALVVLLVAVIAGLVVVAAPPLPSSSPLDPIDCRQLYASQGYGNTRFEHPHTGIDLVCPAGTPVVAIADGVFRRRRGAPVPCAYPAGASGGLGDYGELDSGRLQVLYGHLEAFAVADGSAVTAGTTLGFEGSSGCSSGFHLHFEVHLDGKVVNPCAFLAAGYPAAHTTSGDRCWGMAPP